MELKPYQQQLVDLITANTQREGRAHREHAATATTGNDPWRQRTPEEIRAGIERVREYLTIEEAPEEFRARCDAMYGVAIRQPGAVAREISIGFDMVADGKAWEMKSNTRRFWIIYDEVPVARVDTVTPTTGLWAEPPRLTIAPEPRAKSPGIVHVPKHRRGRWG